MTDLGMAANASPELAIELGDDYVATLEINRPPSNHFSPALICQIADACDELAADARCRAVVLCSAGRIFCAGADFSDAHAIGTPDGSHLYDFAIRIFEQPLPIVAAIQGAAIGGGLGLAMAADFRVAAPEARSTRTTRSTSSTFVPKATDLPSGESATWVRLDAER